MKYEIRKATAPAMPKLGKGTKCIKILLLKASKSMQKPLISMFFLVICAHMGNKNFSILIRFGRNYVTFGPIRWQKVAIIWSN